MQHIPIAVKFLLIILIPFSSTDLNLLTDNFLRPSLAAEALLGAAPSVVSVALTFLQKNCTTEKIENYFL